MRYINLRLTYLYKLEELLDLKRWCTCVTLTFDLLTPIIHRFMPSPRGPLVQLGVIITLLFQNIAFSSLVTDDPMDERMDWTGRELPLSASLAWHGA